ncbi:MAG TPA: AAA family ATPase [Lacipirellulaceae bacterium]|jgi:type II secretory pathway predicted ATPase ExeA|nr:AAA family ATPase [Lacipirellulaceae bacterium]
MPNKQSLPLEFWGLEHWPFRGSVGANQFYPTAGHDEALARIEYLVESRRRLGVLVGEAGIGKSLILRVAAKRLIRSGSVAIVVDALGASVREVLWNLACELKTAPRDDADTAWLWRQIADRVAENRMQHVATVLLVDDAGQAGPDLITQFARLVRLDTSPTARWTIVLAAEAGQAARWNDTLRSAVDLRIEVAPWSVNDTIGYVQTSLVDAGRFDPVFDEGGLRKLHDLACGVPQDVARLADYALLAAAGMSISSIDAASVEAAYEEIAWPAPEAAY